MKLMTETRQLSRKQGNDIGAPVEGLPSASRQSSRYRDAPLRVNRAPSQLSRALAIVSVSTIKIDFKVRRMNKAIILLCAAAICSARFAWASPQCESPSVFQVADPDRAYSLERGWRICKKYIAGIGPKSLVGPISAERDGADMKVNGKIQKLPTGTKIGIEIMHFIRQPNGSLKCCEGPAGPENLEVFLAQDGSFHGSLRNTSWDVKKRANIDNGTFPPGSYIIMIFAYFNGAWQTTEVLRQAGLEFDAKGRAALPPVPRAIPETPDFEPDDPEFPKAGRHLEAIREVTLGPMPPDQAAIDAVKHATLDVKGRGRSSMSIGESIDLNRPLIGMKRLAWSAARGSDVHAKWIVTLEYLAGDGVDQTQQKAQWSYDPVSKTVLYLDPEAKSLSYVPPE
jgi:hypothetical protein